ncbi:MAG: hypothetical protein V1685_04330 [Parcubacteria group bacterium]
MYRRLHCVAFVPTAQLYQGANIQFDHPGSGGKPSISFNQTASSIEVNHHWVEQVEPGTPCGIQIDAAQPLPPPGATITLLD